MRLLYLSFVVAATICSSAFAQCDSLPWKFDMSPAEVAAVEECGPYKRFSNGDLETYNGVYDGKKENFQFFFDQGKLRRIGVYLYEGTDVEAGAQRWLSLYGSLSRQFAAVETPGNIPPSVEDPSGIAFRVGALKGLRSAGKVQMTPARQSKDAFVYSSFMQRVVNNETIYLVILYFDRPMLTGAGKFAMGPSYRKR